jgi:hypothetical protein
LLLETYSAKKSLNLCYTSGHKEIGEVGKQIQIRKSDTKEAITLIYKLRAITVRSDNGSYMIRAISNRSDNVSSQC